MSKILTDAIVTKEIELLDMLLETPKRHDDIEEATKALYDAIHEVYG